MKERPDCREFIENVLKKECDLDVIVETLGQFKFTKRKRLLYNMYNNIKYSKNIRKQAHKMENEESLKNMGFENILSGTSYITKLKNQIADLKDEIRKIDYEGARKRRLLELKRLRDI